jgi:hypothetical protein
MNWILASWLLLNIPPVSPGAPNRQPQMAAGYGEIALTFVGGQSIYFSSSKDDGRTFSAPGKVADAQKLAAGRHRGPRVAILKDAVVITAVASGDLVTWRSTDHGKTWSRAGVVNDVPDAAREGLHAMAAGPRGELFAAWLDLRSKGTKLYGSRSSDGGVTWSPNVLIYTSPAGTICECCHPSVAIDAQGKISVMWRNLLDGSRDLYVSSSNDGTRFTAAQKLGGGTWKLQACPMDGGGLAIDHDQLVSAWRRDGQVYLAPAGKPEKQIGTGKDVAIAAGKDGVYAAWSNGAALEILTPGSALPVQLAADGAFVNLISLSDGGALAAWEAGGTIQMARKLQ